MTAAEALREGHERLCFARAFPRSAAELRRALRELAAFERRIAAEKARLDNSGIAGTLVRYPFNYDIARWLCAKYGPAVTIDWTSYKKRAWDEVAALLSLVVAPAENEGLDAEHVPSWDWVALAKAGSGLTDLQWLLAILQRHAFDEAVARHLYESLSLSLVWDLSSCRDAVTHARLPVRRVFFHGREPLLGRPADFAADVRQPVGRVELLEPARADRWIDAARAALSQREREFHVIVHANREETYRFEAGRGLEVFVFGSRPALRLTLEANYGALLVKNGVPIGYGYAALLLERADIGINVFPTYRAGESAFAFTRFAALFHHHFGSRVLVMRRHQVGYQNTEGLESGSFWFYYKLGFRPAHPRVLRLAEAEAERLAREGGTARTGLALMRRLARSDMVVGLDGTPPDAHREIDIARIGLDVTRLIERRFAGDRARAARELDHELSRVLAEPRLARGPGSRLSPIAALVPDLAAWGTQDKRALAAALLAKEGRGEARYVRAMLRGRRFARFLEGYRRS